MKTKSGHIFFWGCTRRAWMLAVLLLPCMHLNAEGVVGPDQKEEAYRLEVSVAAGFFSIPYHGLTGADCFRLVSREPERWSWNGRTVYDGFIADNHPIDGSFEGIPLPAGISPGDYAFDIMVGYGSGRAVCYSDAVMLVIRVMAVDGSTTMALCSGEAVRYVPECLREGKSEAEKYHWTRAAVEGIREKAAAGTGAVDEVLTNMTDRPLEVTYLYVAEDDECSMGGSFEVVVTVKPRISLEVVNRKPQLCDGEETDIRLLPEGIVFRWKTDTDGASGAEDGEGNHIAQVLHYKELPAVSTYRILGPEGSCMEPEVVGVRVNALPEIGFDPFLTRDGISLGQSIEMTAQPEGYDSYRFVFNGAVTEQRENILHAYEWLPGADNRITVTVVSEEGCTNTTEMIFTGPEVNLPNAITPNGDGRNDRLMEGYELEVFNRNGSQLYSGKDGWDGYYHGKPVPTDTYLYVIHYKTPEGKTIEYKYHVYVRTDN